MVSPFHDERPPPIRCLATTAVVLPPFDADILMTVRPGARDAIISMLAPDVLVIDQVADLPARLAALHRLSPRTRIIVLVPPEELVLLADDSSDNDVAFHATDDLDHLAALIRRMWNA